MKLGAALENIDHAKSFFSEEIWRTPLESLPPKKARRYRAARIAYSVVDGMFLSDSLPFHAAALTYYTVLSIVPLLAFAFSVLKGVGAYDALVEETLRPYVASTFEANSSLRQAIDHVLSFVGETSVASLGFVGLVLVLYAGTGLLRNVESALNGIWGVEHPRTMTQQFKDYTAIIVITPLCLLLAAGLGTSSQVTSVVDFVENTLGAGEVLRWLVQLFGPLVVVTIGLFALYMIMPNTRVRVLSALLGGGLGGALWYMFLVLHVQFQMGVARFNALYSSFAAIPIFLVWAYFSWLSVMVGASAAAAHQHGEARARRIRWARLESANKEAMALSLMVELTRSFVHGTPECVRLEPLSNRLGAPASLLRKVIDCLAAANLVAVTDETEDPRLVLTRAPERIRVSDVLTALRGRIHDGAELDFQPDRDALFALQELTHELEGSPHNRTLRELVTS